MLKIIILTMMKIIILIIMRLIINTESNNNTHSLFH